MQFVPVAPVYVLYIYYNINNRKENANFTLYLLLVFYYIIYYAKHKLAQSKRIKDINQRYILINIYAIIIIIYVHNKILRLRPEKRRDGIF